MMHSYVIVLGSARMAEQVVENGSSRLADATDTLGKPTETVPRPASPPVLLLPGKLDDVATLPEEILVAILDDVIISESLSCRCQSKDANSRSLSTPRRLAQVSRKWRQTVFSCPALWRHVHLTPYQPTHALKEHLNNSSPFPLHITVHQWPFRNPIPASGPLSITTLTTQLHSIISPTETDPSGACTRVQSISINATECSTFLNFVLQTWTGRGSKFPALRRVSMNGHLLATWSRACFFDGKNAPGLETLELTNVMIAHNAHRLPWGIGLNITTLVWSALSQNGSLVISATIFHHIVSSFPSLKTLEVHGQVILLGSVTPDHLASAGATPLNHIEVLNVRGHTFTSLGSAFIFFSFFPSLKRLVVRGNSCTGLTTSRTIMHAVNAFIQFPMVLPILEDLELECVDIPYAKWWKWASEELEGWRTRRGAGYQGRTGSVPSVRMDLVLDKTLYTDEGQE